MNIIIEGCGKTGYAIAKQMADEGHEITMIDADPDNLQRACLSLDVNGVEGNGTVVSVLTEAGVENCDVFVAVTKYDEVNLLSCLIAKKAAGHRLHTVAKVRNPEYYEEISFLQEELDISLTFNPDDMTANEIYLLLHTPNALEIDTFAKGQMTMMTMKIPEGSALDQMSIASMGSKFSNVLVCALERNKEVLIPDGQTVLQSGDIISVSLSVKDGYKFFEEVGLKTRPVKDVAIGGGDAMTYYLAKKLLAEGIHVTIVEPDFKTCENLSESLDDAIVINGDINDGDLLAEEGIMEKDAVIALARYDEDNIVFSLFAGQNSKAKVITKINRSEFLDLFGELPGAQVCPRNLISEFVIRYVRSLENITGESNVNALYKLSGGRAEAMEFDITEKSRVINTPLSELKLKNNLLICNINRGNVNIRPSGSDELKPGDAVVVVTTHKGLHAIDDILA